MPESRSTLGPASVRAPLSLTTRLRRCCASTCLAALLAGNAQAGIVTVDTSTIAGAAARLEVTLFDGDGIAGNSSVSAFSQEVSDFGQIFNDFIGGGTLSFHLDFSLAASDALVLSILDADTNFTLFDTDLDALDASVPYEDAVLVCSAQAGRCTTPARSDPSLDVAFVPEPATWALLGFLPAAMAWRRRDRAS